MACKGYIFTSHWDDLDLNNTYGMQGLQSACMATECLHGMQGLQSACRVPAWLLSACMACKGCRVPAECLHGYRMPAWHARAAECLHGADASECPAQGTLHMRYQARFLEIRHPALLLCLRLCPCLAVQNALMDVPAPQHSTCAVCARSCFCTRALAMAPVQGLQTALELVMLYGDLVGMLDAILDGTHFTLAGQ